MQYGFKNLPLGLPMTIASVGTLATLWAGKKFHAGFGLAWAALSFWHGWQHHKKMQADVKKLTGCCCVEKPEAVATLGRMAVSFQVDSYLPGRIRLRSKDAFCQSAVAESSGGLPDVLYGRQECGGKSVDGVTAYHV